MLVFWCHQLKDPGQGAIVQADQAIHANPPLCLQPQEQLQRLPVLLPYLEQIRLAGRLWQHQTKRCRIIWGFIDNATASPVLGGLDQFFRLAPCRLVK